MTKTDPSQTEETSELTDEAAKAIGKARRSFSFSMGILLLGFMAIVLALVYRATKDGESAAEPYALEAIIIPNGAEVISLVPLRDVIAVTYAFEGQTALRMIDAQSGELIKEIPVTGE